MPWLVLEILGLLPKDVQLFPAHSQAFQMCPWGGNRLLRKISLSKWWWTSVEGQGGVAGETLQKSIFLALVLVQLALLGLRPWVLTVHFGPPGGPVGPSLTLR